MFILILTGAFFHSGIIPVFQLAYNSQFLFPIRSIQEENKSLLSERTVLKMLIKSRFFSLENRAEIKKKPFIEFL
jgi:hypothetical protein